MSFCKDLNLIHSLINAISEFPPAISQQKQTAWFYFSTLLSETNAGEIIAAETVAKGYHT